MDYKIKKIIGRNYLIIILVYALTIFLLNDIGNVIEFLTFNVNAPDLQGGDITAIEIRNLIFSQTYSYGLLVSDIGNKNEILIPFIISLTVFIYSNYKNRYLKYSIGKDTNYKKLVFNSKIKLLSANCILLSSVFLIYILVSYILTGLKYREGVDFLVFDDYKIKSDFIVILLYFIEMNLFSFSLGYLILMIADRIKSPLKISIISIISIYLMSGFIHIIVSPIYSLTASIDWIFMGYTKVIMLFISYVYIVIAYIIIKLFISKDQ